MTDQGFVRRHIGPGPRDIQDMLATLGLASLDALVDAVVPRRIRAARPLDLPAPASEDEAVARLAAHANANVRYRSYIGAGYHGCITPPVILRNVLENPGWYTAYTPYQAEIAQGRLEALVVFEMMVQDLTGFEVSNASLLDEATAAAEAMTMCHRTARRGAPDRFFVASSCHPQTIAVVRTRAEALGFALIVGDPDAFDFSEPVFGALIQSPATDGTLPDVAGFCARARAADVRTAVATDLLALTMLVPPGEQGADMAIGSTQRFGVPMGFGGPHAAFLATSAGHARKMPGRIIGVSRDADGGVALRMSLQTREQHIRRQKATSNVCTAQVLLAVVAAMFAVYHGPEGVRGIGRRVHDQARRLASALGAAGFETSAAFFDTVRVAVPDAGAVLAAALERGINLRALDATTVCVALDETVGEDDLADVLAAFGATPVAASDAIGLPEGVVRTSTYLQHPVFSDYHSETEMLRYLHRMQAKDLSLTTAMIPLGSCTMKLNATSEMIPVTWPGFSELHPFVPDEQSAGYRAMIGELSDWLAEITGFAGISMQPNAGSQGEYAGLLVLRRYHEDRGEGHRNICLIPRSAHGTNPASAVMAGMEVVEVACDDQGNIDVADLERLADLHAPSLSALMVTYPSTHGVFEESIIDICRIVHERGGQVYMDGANLNAQVGLCRPAEMGADVCHLNLHKTFCIPHGGGGPGMGPIGVAPHLVPFLPGHPEVDGDARAIGPVSAAPYGSPEILPISWAYVAMMGGEGLTRATQVAILNANYIAHRLAPHFPVLYSGRGGFVAHECILDLRHLKDSAGIEVDDVAKRLMDYGFHGPTMSWPVPGTLMVEPTESESKRELDRFIDAMIQIRGEIRDIEEGRADRLDNPLKRAPHTARVLVEEPWDRAYSRRQAVFPTAWTLAHKFWPAVSRVDNAYGDRHLSTRLPEGG